MEKNSSRVNQYLIRRHNLIRKFTLFTIFYFCSYAIGNAILPIIAMIYDFAVPTTWPISILGLPVARYTSYPIAIMSLVLLYMVIKYGNLLQRKIVWVLIVGFLLILMTNLIHGFEDGIRFPIVEYSSATGAGEGYWHDISKIKSPVDFLQIFNFRQGSFSTHSQTHPPGAVLLYYAMDNVLPDPWMIGVVLGLISTLLGGFFYYRLLRMELESTPAKLFTLLFLLLPAVQVYFITSLDAVVCMLVLGIIYGLALEKQHISVLITLILFFMLSFVTFSVVFIIPVMVVWEYLRYKNIYRSMTVFSLTLLVYILLVVGVNFNYWESFVSAVRVQNPLGFKLFTQTASYLFTRLENIAEVFFFFGPILSYILLKSIRRLKKTAIDSELTKLARTSIIILGVMYLTGMYSDGETARINLFIYPFLLIPIAVVWSNFRLANWETSFLLLGVFFQSVVMQTLYTFFY